MVFVAGCNFLLLMSGPHLVLCVSHFSLREGDFLDFPATRVCPHWSQCVKFNFPKVKMIEKGGNILYQEFDCIAQCFDRFPFYFFKNTAFI